MWIQKNYKTIIRLCYIIPILFAAGVSIAHVVTWYGMTNPISWAIYLSVGIEIAALSALAGITAKMGKSVYFPFIIVTFIQFIGNVFFSFQYIQLNDPVFLSWVDLVGPMFDWIGMADLTDLLAHRRWLALLSGGLIPVISLSFLHLLISFNDREDKKSLVEPPKDPTPPTSESKPKMTDAEAEKEFIHYSIRSPRKRREPLNLLEDVADYPITKDDIKRRFIIPVGDVKIKNKVDKNLITPDLFIPTDSDDYEVEFEPKQPDLESEPDIEDVELEELAPETQLEAIGDSNEGEPIGNAPKFKNHPIIENKKQERMSIGPVKDKHPNQVFYNKKQI